MNGRWLDGDRKGVWVEDGPQMEPVASQIPLGLERWGRKGRWSVDMVGCGGREEDPGGCGWIMIVMRGAVSGVTPLGWGASGGFWERGGGGDVEAPHGMSCWPGTCWGSMVLFHLSGSKTCFFLDLIGCPGNDNFTWYLAKGGGQ